MNDINVYSLFCIRIPKTFSQLMEWSENSLFLINNNNIVNINDKEFGRNYFPLTINYIKDEKMSNKTIYASNKLNAKNLCELSLISK